MRLRWKRRFRRQSWSGKPDQHDSGGTTSEQRPPGALRPAQPIGSHPGLAQRRRLFEQQRRGGAFGTALALDAVASGPKPEWALYYLNPGGAWSTVSLLFDSTPDAWIARANYATGRWDISGPYLSGATLSAADPTYRSPDGGLWIAVIAAPGSETRLYALTTKSVVGINQPPSVSLLADNTSGGAPMTVNFDASGSSDPDGTIIQYAWDWEGDSVFDDYTDTPLVSHTFTGAGTFNTFVLVVDDQFMPNGTNIGISVNAAPSADLLASPLVGEPGDTLELDASGSSDPNGTIVAWHWDMDGDGIFAEPGGEDSYNGAVTISTHFPDDPAYFRISVQVTDDAGSTAVASVDLTCEGWAKQVLDDDAPLEDSNRTSSQVSLELVGGKPALSYRDNGTLRYAWSTAADGWPVASWSSVEVDAACSPGGTSLAVINGKPAICYDGADLLGSTEVRYAWSTAADGSTGWNDLLLGIDGGYDLTIALSEVGGFPMASYNEDSQGKLVTQRSTQADGSSGWAATDQFVGISAISQPVLASGNPALARFHTNLCFSRNSATNGSGTWSDVAADPDPSSGNYPSLALAGGNPAISHCDYFDKDLRYSWSTQADGASGWNTVAVAPATSGGGWNWLSVVGGKPAIAYYDSGATALKFARSTQTDGSSGWSSTQIEDNVGIFVTGVTLGSGQPALAYYDIVNDDLKYAVLFE